jgi:hypothetical protein
MQRRGGVVYRGSVKERGFDARHGRRLHPPPRSANLRETPQRGVFSRPRAGASSGGSPTRSEPGSRTPSGEAERDAVGSGYEAGTGKPRGGPTACSPYRGGGVAVRWRPPLLDLEIVAAARALATATRCRLGAEALDRVSRRSTRGDGVASRRRCASSARTTGSCGPDEFILAP